MKTILKVFITLIITVPFNRAFANCTSPLSIFEKYCDSEGYYIDDTPSYGNIVQNCDKNEIIFTCYKFKDKYNKNKLEKELQKCCDKKNTTITIKSATRPDGHIHRESEKCNKENFPGAKDAKWDDDNKKCKITCDTNTHEATPVDGKCVKLPSDAYKTASEALKNLLKQAQTALTALTEKKTKEAETA